MKKSRFTDSQIIEAIKRVEAGLAVAEPSRTMMQEWADRLDALEENYVSSLE